SSSSPTAPQEIETVAAWALGAANAQSVPASNAPLSQLRIATPPQFSPNVRIATPDPSNLAERSRRVSPAARSTSAPRPSGRIGSPRGSGPPRTLPRTIACRSHPVGAVERTCAIHRMETGRAQSRNRQRPWSAMLPPRSSKEPDPPQWHTPQAVAIERTRDRKSTRLNSSHVKISYAVFCLKKKKQPQERNHDAVTPQHELHQRAALAMQHWMTQRDRSRDSAKQQHEIAADVHLLHYTRWNP